MTEVPNDPIFDRSRLLALKATGLLDSPPEASFDRLTRLAARLFGCPVALISLVDSDRQFFKSHFGLVMPWSELRQTPLSHSFCQHVVVSGKPLVVEDARTMELVSTNLAITELGVIAYLGVPLISEEGSILGSFCLIDAKPRPWSEEEVGLLRDLADSATTEILLRADKAELLRAESRLSIQFSTARILAEATTLSEAIGSILRLVGEGFDFDAGEYWALDRPAGLLRKSEESWELGPAAAEFAAASKSFTFERGQGLPGRVWATGNPSWIEELDRDENFLRIPLAARSGLRSGFGLPIVGDSGLIGVMTFLIRESRTPDPVLLGALEILGRQIGLFAVRKQAEAEVIRLNEQFGAVLDSATHIAIIAADENGVIVIFNAGAERMLGYDRGELVGVRSLDAVLLDADVDALLELARGDAGSRAGENREREMTFLRKDGVRLTVSIALSVVHNIAGGATGLLGIAKDVTESRHAEREMRKFVALVEHSGDLIAMVDFEGRLDYINPAGRELVGLADSSVALTASDLLDGPTLAVAKAEALSTGHWVGEGSLEHFDGDGPIEVDINLFLVSEPESDRPLCLATIIRDARGRKTAESMLQEKEARLRCILESSLDCLITIDQEGRVVEFNPASERTFGFRRSEAIGRALADLIVPPEARGSHQSGLARFLETGESVVIGRRLEIEAIRADGSRIMVELAVSVVDIGGPPLFTASLRDVSERIKSERALRESEQRFRGSFDGAPIGMALVATDGRWLRVNRALCEIVGYSEPQMLGMNFQSITHPDDLEHDLTIARSLLDRENQSYDIEKRYLHAGGNSVWVSLNASVVRDESGAPLYFIYQIQDITRRKEIERDLEWAKERAVNASQSKSKFLANMSHEVRTPMAAILGYSDMLLDPRLSQAERDQALQAIRRNGTHLLQIINDILDLSKIEAGRVDLELIRYSPWQVVLEVVSTLRIRANEKGVVMETRTVGPIPASAFMDPTRFRQILVNLVSNAIKFSEPGGLVVIRVEAIPGVEGEAFTLRVEVEDSGIGMTPSQLDQLFIPFQQADSSTTRRFGGTGLGLSITRRLAEAMRGTISVRSEIGRGSCFTALVPMQTDEGPSSWLDADALAVHVAPSGEFDGEAKIPILDGRILLAEDNPDNQRVLLYHLCRMGLEVEVADNGRIAVEKALRGTFDLVLMDMQMPELDGYGATSSLRRAGFLVPIVALTAHAMIEDREKCLRAGCTDFLTKPVEAGRLGAVLAKHLGSRGAGGGSRTPEGAILSTFRDDPGMDDLVREFVGGLPEQAGRLRSMLGDDDLRGLESLAHQLRGVGGMYGFPELTEIASLIEDAVREGRDAELLGELVDEFGETVRKIGLGLDS